MDQHALQVLEFGKVLQQLADHTATEVGAALALVLAPAGNLGEVQLRQTQTAEARQLLDDFGGMPLGGAHNILPHLEKAVRAGCLDGRELLDIAETLTASERLSAFLRKHSLLTPELSTLASSLASLPDVSKSIAEAIDQAAEVRDSASSKLASVRREMRTVAGRVQEKLNGILQGTATREALQDPVIVSRHGRWCVPVRSSHKSVVPGVVHDASASGATLFVEPQSVVELGNRLRQLEAEEQDEIERILRALTAKVAQSADDLRVNVNVIASLDLANASALLAEAHRAVRPSIHPGAFLNFRQARHPLLKGDVVPIDVRVGSDFQGLLITGPNTGGKTVTLKTVGLLTLMAQAGLQIPAAEGSQCGVFADIFADIGDEQSIEQSLSTFSGHVRNIIRTLQRIEPGSLVLFDELGSGTDPAEGAALASAVLRWLADKDVCIVATSHYGELKSFAYATPGFENASVEFDKESLRPTYRLLTGVPGASHALHIAGKLGMPAEVLEDAATELRGRKTSADDLIQKVEESRLRAIEEEKRARDARQEAEGLRGRYERDITKLSQTREQVRDQLQTEAQRAIREAQSELEKVLRELRTQKRHSQHTEGLANKAKRLVKRIEKTVVEAAPSVPEPEPVERVRQRTLRKGDSVRVVAIGTTGTVLSDPDKGEALVQIGSMEARIALDGLELIKPPAPPQHRTVHAPVQMQRALSVSPEIMLRGQRVADALESLDRYLDDACLAGMDKVKVIHGKGTGVMRKAVWEFMRKHPLVSSLSIADVDDGGEGATIATLK
ncbi:MAG: endonuclease MutS2 [Armatimonadetes bacterium]|nr:endonuclease MutS2 [Armatimonadota bacterium]